jgi:hypothetical protein
MQFSFDKGMAFHFYTVCSPDFPYGVAEYVFFFRTKVALRNGADILTQFDEIEIMVFPRFTVVTQNALRGAGPGDFGNHEFALVF